jgi:hypothetical protein
MSMLAALQTNGLSASTLAQNADMFSGGDTLISFKQQISIFSNKFLRMPFLNTICTLSLISILYPAVSMVKVSRKKLVALAGIII